MHIQTNTQSLNQNNLILVAMPSGNVELHKVKVITAVNIREYLYLGQAILENRNVFLHLFLGCFRCVVLRGVQRIWDGGWVRQGGCNAIPVLLNHYHHHHHHHLLHLPSPPHHDRYVQVISVVAYDKISNMSVHSGSERTIIAVSTWDTPTPPHLTVQPWTSCVRHSHLEKVCQKHCKSYSNVWQGPATTHMEKLCKKLFGITLVMYNTCMMNLWRRASIYISYENVTMPFNIHGRS